MSTTLKTRIEKASEILNPYFDKLKAEKADTSIEDPYEFLARILENLGIDNSAIGLQILESDSTKFEDFQRAVHDRGYEDNDFPIPRLRFAWKTLKDSKDTSVKHSVDSELIKVLKPIGQWSDLELLEKYGPECSPEITDMLQRHSKSRHCIILNDDGSVDVENSLYMLRKARHQETPAHYKLNGQRVKVYRIGYFPAKFFFECPIHKNSLLIEGYCDDCGITWNTNEYRKNVLLRLVTELESVDMRQYRDKTFDELSDLFPKAINKFIELEKEENLPKLKKKVSDSKDGDPFRVLTNHNTY